ncbi:MAG: GntR family transcriptional regulator [Actinomycetota bacterium]
MAPAEGAGRDAGGRQAAPASEDRDPLRLADDELRQAGELSTELVHARLRDAILHGEFDPHVPISQVQLAQRLGVSRTPLREALRMLQREGLIDSEPNRRVRVAALSVADLEQLYAARVVIDALTLRLSVARFSDEDLTEMEQCLRTMERLAADRDVDLWEESHRAFHGTFRRYAGDRFERMAGDLSDHTERYRRVYLAEPRAWTAAAEEHRAVYEACRARRPTEAAQLLARHLARTALTLIAALDPEHDPRPVREALRLVTGEPDGAAADQAGSPGTVPS